MNQPLLDAGQNLINLATRSRYVLDLLQRPIELNLNTLHWDYAGSMLSFAPINLETVGNAPAYLEKKWWEGINPAEREALNAGAAIDHNVHYMRETIAAGSGGIFSRIFGGEKKKAAEAAAFDLQTRLAETESTVQTLRALFDRASAETAVLTPAQAFATNTFGFKDTLGSQLAHFVGEDWQQVTWREVAAYKVQAYHRVMAATDTEERKTLIGGIAGDMAKLKEERARLVLRNVPVEKLRELTSGSVRTAPLVSAGITSVDQVLNHDPASLTRYQGIGESTAAQIIAAARRLLDESVSYEKDAVGEARTPAAERILIALARLKDIDAGISDTELLTRLRTYTPLLAQAEPSSGTYWVAIGEEHDDFSVFEADLAWCEANQSIHIPPAQWLSPDAAWESYRVNPAEYQTLLAHYLGNDALQDDGLLDARLVERIRKYPLDTTHLNAKLRGYQTYGAKFMLAQRKVILGDEMGLGKTMQSIAAIAHLKAKDKTHFVVVCPASVVINWGREVEKFSDIAVYTAHGSNREAHVDAWKRNGGVIVVTYDGARLYIDESWPVHALIADEAHLVKNPQTLRSQAVAALVARAENAVLLSGTPMENKVGEFVNLVRYLQPELISAGMDSLLPLEFRQKVAPAYLRRNQKDVLAELPGVIEHRDWVALSPADSDAYRSAVAEGNFALMRRAAWASDSSAKLERFDEIIEEAGANGRKVLVFSFFIDVLEKLDAHLGEKSVGIIRGSVAIEGRQQLVDDLSAAPDGAVLLSQITAGGAGLNIQSASIVILCEPQFKPTIESQAIARAHRMGQINTVDVYRLLGTDTVDERMLELLGTKSALFDDYARASATKEAAAEAVDISDAAMAQRIIAGERARLGLDTEAPVVTDEDPKMNSTAPSSV